MSAGSFVNGSIRVGFVIDHNFDAWLGGFNYFKALIHSVMDLPERRIEPVIFTGSANYKRVANTFPDNEVVVPACFRSNSFAGYVRGVLKRFSGRDILWSRVLAAYQVDAVSHSGFDFACSAAPFLCWIPDFQHWSLPHLFSESERQWRDDRFRAMCRMAAAVIVSSRDALNTLAAFDHESVGKAVVLHFVPNPGDGGEYVSLERLKAKYGLPDRYFHVPNQFWAHKNHELIIDAIGILKREGCNVNVVATGHTKDPRHPGHYDALMEKVRKAGLNDCFTSLGIVPFADLMAIMRYAIAVINPSLFEGWSTTVEEAKSMGKQVILSDIAVHREQRPERGVYVDPQDPYKLAQAMARVGREWHVETDKKFAEKASAALPARRAAFAQCYQNIVMAALGRAGEKGPQFN